MNTDGHRLGTSFTFWDFRAGVDTFVIFSGVRTTDPEQLLFGRDIASTGALVFSSESKRSGQWEGVLFAEAIWNYRAERKVSYL